MQENNKGNTPLWKELNEKRTQGVWKVDVHDNDTSKWYGNITAMLGKEDNGIMNIETISCQNKRHGIDHAAINSQYTALAVNNLHHLAEALENVLWNFEGKDNLSPVQQSAIKQAKEALKRIS